MLTSHLPTGLKESDPAVSRFSGELRDPELEDRFRLWRYDVAIPQHRLVAGLLVVATIPFILQIWQVWGLRQEFFILAGLRSVQFAFSVLALVWSLQRREYQRLDLIAALCLYAVLTTNLTALILSQEVGTLIIVQMLLVTAFAYIIYPGRLVHAFGPLTIFSGCLCAALIFHFQVLPSDRVGLFTWTLIVNFVGFLAARQFNIFRRREFLAVMEVQERAQELEAARAAAVDARREAEHANRAKSAMLANTSHELRTPLNAILGYSEMIHRELLGPVGNKRYGEYAGDIHNSGRHLLKLIDDLLDISKIEAGKTELQHEWLDMAAVTGGVCRMAETRAADKEQQVVCLIDPAASTLFADNRSVTQILLNLVTNAVKFSGEGETITVRTMREDDGGLKLAVLDNGIGIAPDQIDRILKPFEQVEVDPTKPKEGWGLGLALVNSLAALHQADLTLQPRPGGGTIASVTFPPDRCASRTITRQAHLSLAAAG